MTLFNTLIISQNFCATCATINQTEPKNSEVSWLTTSLLLLALALSWFGRPLKCRAAVRLHAPTILKIRIGNAPPVRSTKFQRVSIAATAREIFLQTPKIKSNYKQHIKRDSNVNSQPPEQNRRPYIGVDRTRERLRPPASRAARAGAPAPCRTHGVDLPADGASVRGPEAAAADARR